MVFYIHDQGARTTTPVDRLLAQRRVTATAKITAVRSVDEQPPFSEQQVASTEYAEQQQATLSVRKQLVYAQDIMSSPVFTGQLDQVLDDAWMLLAKKGFHHIPVVDKHNCLCGIVSDRDFLRFTANNSANRAIGKTPIARLMTPQVISAAANAHIRTIAEVMCRQAIGAVPIVNDDSFVIGIVTRSDILHTLVNQAPIELWA